MGLDPGRLQDKVCAVTGAASVIAEAVTSRLTSEGATVVGVDYASTALGRAHCGPT
jgi:NADP-dependent 3-hydroxy acid dehydrogenase YdfG